MDNIQLARKDIDNICCIYASVGAAMFNEARDRLACRFAARLDAKDKEIRSLKQNLCQECRDEFHTGS